MGFVLDHFLRSFSFWFFFSLLYPPVKAPPNFLRAAALAEYKRPVVVIENEERFDDVEPQPDLRDSQQVCFQT